MRILKVILCYLAVFAYATPSDAQDQRAVYLEPLDGPRVQIGHLDLQTDGQYRFNLSEASFTDHFLSMRPFKCLEGSQKHWCYVPYPYENARNIQGDLTDLEYDLLFLWKGATDYGINMWNGVYYVLRHDGEQIIGTLHEMDMDILSAPPDAGNLRPIAVDDLHESDPDSHWLPKLVIE